MTYRQLVAIGIGPDSIKRRVARGTLHRIYIGVYAVGRRDLTAHGRFIAAVFACGDGALLSHHCAADLWGIRRTSSARLSVTIEGSSRSGPPGVRPYCCRSLHPDDRAERDGIPVTSIARTIIDLAASQPPRVAEWAFEEAERLRLLDMRKLEAACDRGRGRRGVKVVRALIANATEPPPTKSELERRFLAACREANLPEPQINTSIEGFEVDFVWATHKLAVELDSRTHHERRRAFEIDRDRDARLLLAGYRVLRVTHSRLTTRIAELTRVLARPPQSEQPERSP